MKLNDTIELNAENNICKILHFHYGKAVFELVSLQFSFKR